VGIQRVSDKYVEFLLSTGFPSAETFLGISRGNRKDALTVHFAPSFQLTHVALLLTEMKVRD